MSLPVVPLVCTMVVVVPVVVDAVVVPRAVAAADSCSNEIQSGPTQFGFHSDSPVDSVHSNLPVHST